MTMQFECFSKWLPIILIFLSILKLKEGQRKCYVTVHKFYTWQSLQAVVGSFTRSSEITTKNPNRLSNIWLYKFLLLLEVEILNFQIQDLGIASLSRIIPLYYASILPCVHQQPSSWLPSAVPAPPRHHFCQHGQATARSLQELLGAGTAAAFTHSQGPAGHMERNQCPLKPKWRARVGNSTFGSSRSMRLAMDHLVIRALIKAGMKAFLARAAFLVARSVLTISSTPCPHSLLLPCTWLWTELKTILLRLPLQLWHHYLLHPTRSSISQLSVLVSDFWVPTLPVPAASQTKKVQKP